MKEDRYEYNSYMIINNKYNYDEIRSLVDSYMYKSDLEIKRELREKKIKRIMK